VPKHILTSQDKEEILLKSDKFTAKQLAEQYNCSRSTILKLWMDNDYHKPTGYSYYVDDHYFSNIDTPNKAYIIGLIASDGNIYKRDEHQGQIRLSLQNTESEYNLLTAILSDMRATHPIKKTTLVSNGVQREYISVTIVSDQIYNDLFSIGITPQKTWTMDIEYVLNNIPRRFVNDFLRGYFDGDGCITGVNKNRPSSTHIHIAMPMQNANMLKQYLLSFGIDSLALADNRSGKYAHPFGRIEFFGANKYIFLKWIYYKDCICLQRKYDSAMKYCNLVEKNITNRSENIKATNQYNIFLEHNKVIGGEPYDQSEKNK
jgi:intein-encoded DNA endonuclease-like protein